MALMCLAGRSLAFNRCLVRNVKRLMNSGSRACKQVDTHRGKYNEVDFDYDSKLGPYQPFFEKPHSIVFSPKHILKEWGALPIIFITAIGFLCEVITWARIATSRDDVQWTRQPPACEIVDTAQNGITSPIRKFKVYNQKYATPPGLLMALQGKTDECPMEPPPETLDWYLIMGRFLPWAVWGAFLYLFDLF